jgi:FKBP-type peptidyl-prolyl cis-trans isomerase FkpA
MRQNAAMRSTLLALTLLACAAAGAQTPAAPAAAAAKITTPSGIVFESERAGTGASPKASDTVTVNYRGTFPDGREFDSSYKRGQPTSFPLDRVIPCWTEAVQMMKVGGKAHITCPAKLAYGERGAGNVIPPNATLMFDIELLGIR